MNEPCDVSTYDRDGVSVVEAAGEFDIATVALLRDALLDAIARSGRVTLELSRTAFIDSTALGALIAAHKAATRAGGWLRIASPSRYVRRVLELMALDSLIGVYESVDAAVAEGGTGAHA